MKRFNVLFFFFMLLSVVKIQAQNDSIYGLEVEKKDHIINLNFYSTYDIDNLKSIDFVFYDKVTGQRIEKKSAYYYEERELYSMFGNVIIEFVSENVYRITLIDGKFHTYTNAGQQMDIYLLGYDYGLSSDFEIEEVKKKKKPEKSNVLSVIFK